MNVLTEYETLDKIKEGKSISRYGDGEFYMISSHGGTIYEHMNDRLSHKLREVLNSRGDKHLVCIPNVFRDDLNLDPDWTSVESQLERAKGYPEYLDESYTYGSSFISRPEVNHNMTDEYFAHAKKQLFDGRKIALVGNFIHVDAVNDILRGYLLQDVEHIKIVPTVRTNAYNEYPNIVAACGEIPDDYVLYIALGATGTILAYDMCEFGYQAVDVGCLFRFYKYHIEGKIPKYVDKEWSD